MKKLFTLALVCILAFTSFAQEPGEIDTNFGTDGVFVFHPSKVDKYGYFDYVYKILVQEDGKILTIGESRTDKMSYVIYISRHNVDGTLDETYGESGYVFLKVSDLVIKNCPYDAVLKDGKLYVAGYSYNGYNRGFILCLDENGFANEDYGDKGWIVTEDGDKYGLVYEGIDIDSKGRCVVVGYYNDEIIVKRYNAKGKPDMTFGVDGVASIELDPDPNTHSYAYDVKILDDGKIILCGDKRAGGEDGMFIWSYMMRLNSNGDRDNTFGENGVVYLWTGEYAEFALSIDVQPNGKYIVGGHDELWSDTPELPRYESFVTRVNTDGTIDETFGEEGYVKIEPFQGDGCVNYSYSILAAPDGQIFGTVYSRNISEEVFRGYVYNLDENGQFNENFAGSGIVPLPKVYEEQDEINTYSIALQGNDKLIVAGYAAYDDPDEPGPGDYTKIYLTCVNVAVEGNGDNNEDDNNGNDTTGVVGNYENRFEIHPNPATTTIFIEGALNDNAQVSIIDLTGRCVKEVVISNTVSSINIEDLESGVYFISVKQNENNYVEKLVIK